MFLHFADSSIYNKEARGPSDALQNGLLGLVDLGWTNNEYYKKCGTGKSLSEAECNTLHCRPVQNKIGTE